MADDAVTPLAGVWIEIPSPTVFSVRHRLVTPLAGVWIEINSGWVLYSVHEVTPLAGVWIEIPPILMTG